MLAPVSPGIRFASTSAGRVAYSVTGSGPPLLYLLGWVSHLGLMWELPAHRRFVEVLGHYNPHTKELVLKHDQIATRLSHGAQPSKSAGPTPSNRIIPAPHGDLPHFCGPTTIERR